MSLLIGCHVLTWLRWWGRSCRCGSGRCDKCSEWWKGSTVQVTIATTVDCFVTMTTHALRSPSESIPANGKTQHIVVTSTNHLQPGVFCSYLTETWYHRRLHSAKNWSPVHCCRYLDTWTPIRGERGMLRNVVSCSVVTWLRSCSKDLSPDLLTDLELFSETLIRAKHKETQTLFLKEE